MGGISTNNPFLLGFIMLGTCWWLVRRVLLVVRVVVVGTLLVGVVVWCLVRCWVLG